MYRTVSLNTENPFNLSYEIFFPEDYSEKEQDLPLLIFLHGAGERGTNIDDVNTYALPNLISEGMELPAVVLCPQCPWEFVWDNLVRDLKALIDCTVEKYGISKDRICITGASMGGFGTWTMGMCYPGFFSAIAPVAGGGMSWRTPNLKTTPVFAVHGDSDTTVPFVYSQLMVNAVNKNGGNAQLIVLPGFEHGNGIEYAYEHTELINWILAQRREDFSSTAEPFSAEFSGNIYG